MGAKTFSRTVFVIAIALGILTGLGSFTFFYAEGISYFSENPKACMNCHIMTHQFNSWASSGHHHVATCNDCHLPKRGIRKYLAKARNGWNHSLAFTLENFPEPIQISPKNKELLQENCVRCHDRLVHHLVHHPGHDALIAPSGKTEDIPSCIHCHRNIGHMPIH